MQFFILSFILASILSVVASQSSNSTIELAGGYHGVDVSSSITSSAATCFKNAGPTCSKSANTQMGELVDHLRADCKSKWSGRVWLDIEGSQYWTGSPSKNQAWYKDLTASCAKHSVTCGVYSSASQWSAIFGSSSFSHGGDFPLWYAHYDGVASFADFSAFGGWSKPTAKQYQ
eukprot:gene28374-35217_t